MKHAHPVIIKLAYPVIIELEFPAIIELACPVARTGGGGDAVTADLFYEVQEQLEDFRGDGFSNFCVFGYLARCSVL